MKKLIVQKKAFLQAKLAGISGKSVLFCVFLSAVMITICSTCSFLFATNSWIDANCIFTAARSVFHGRVLYRDVMDHKGFYIYVINILGYLLSRRSFFGMYLVEILFFSVFLYFSYRSLRLYVSRPTADRLLPLFAAVTAACNSFDQGCSAEEFVLPMAAASIYFMLRYLANDCDEARMGWNTLLANGVLAGIVLWLKYTMLGLWFGFMAVTFFLMLSKKQVKRAFLSCLVFLGGMAAATIPVLLYFGIHNALKDCWNIYFYGNIFVYASEKTSLTDRLSTMCRYYLRQSKGNPLVTLSVWGGIFWTLFFLSGGTGPDRTDRSETDPDDADFNGTEHDGAGSPSRRGGVSGQETGKIRILLCRLALPAMYLFLLLGVYWGGKNYWYYFLITAPFGVLGFIALGMIWERTGWQRFWTGRKHTILLTGLTALSIVWAWFTCNNASLHLENWEDTEQYQFARIMDRSEHPTLQVYNFFDTGFYNALDIVPTCPHFTLLNQRELMEAAQAAQYDTILHRQVEYVICWNAVPSFIRERYDPVAYHEDSGHILLRRNNAQRYTTTFVGQEDGRQIATADCISWHCVRNGQEMVLEASLPESVVSGSLRITMDVPETEQPTETEQLTEMEQFTETEQITETGQLLITEQVPEFQVAGPEGDFTSAQIACSVDINGTRSVLLTFPDMQLTRIRVLPGQQTKDWQARIDILTSESRDTPLYASPIEKPLGHENSAASYLTMDNDTDTGWHTESAQTKGQVFDLILDQPYADICGVKLTTDPQNEKYARALRIYSTPDNENWNILDSRSKNQTDFFFDTETTCMLRLITGDIPEGTAEEWAINEVYLWRVILAEEDPMPPSAFFSQSK